ncbi:MAG: hypothetical protein QM569_15815 [Acidovorax sp.]|uniref:hypothetical protein n=1 Tax=Acidovorax sp. TaxID=1872122 RepID=UPI0039E3BF33
MDVLILAIFIATGIYLLNAKAQRRRIALLGRYLAPYQIEKLMQTLTDGYLRALGEATDERRDQVWSLLGSTEAQLTDQFSRFAADFARVDDADARVSRLAVALPFAEKVLPALSFDMRRALAIHARGIAHVAQNTSHLAPKDRAFMMTAELLLMQHTCHWYCKSRTIATARMLARHQTPHAQLIDSVSPETRSAYLALIRG